MNTSRVLGSRISGILGNSRCFKIIRKSSTKSPRDSELVEPPLSKEIGRPRRILSTLTPNLLRTEDFLDLAGKRRLRVSFPNSKKGSAGFQFHYERLTVHTPNRTFTPFPDDARGFLYFAPHPALPPHLAIYGASFRFRCTPDRLPSSFDAGYDLRLHGLPWQTLLLQPAITGSPILREQLLREEHITTQTLAAIRARIGTRTRIAPALMLFRLNQLFPVHFSRSLTLDVFGLDRVHHLALGHIFANHIGTSISYPFEGSALARFERSDTNPNVLHLRIAETLEPVSVFGGSTAGPPRRSRGPPPKFGVRVPDTGYWDIVRPCAGELLHIRRVIPSLSELSPNSLGSTEPWEINLQSMGENGKALRALVALG
ncbi:hypothetical protein MSAN_00454400 [Mycena sanguinolenta]|uniref:Uncharacterized protein n=1 Tax=Mycena sanguinolenta TaxID=230812 RepID=A0A8H6ZB30_9AGAR|nr:hypothetical protein MSAN_00454400 [Mycena sanguinolenta]